jgi:hypothetical protein
MRQQGRGARCKSPRWHDKKLRLSPARDKRGEWKKKEGYNMVELVNELTRVKTGLYNLKITTADGKPVLNVGNISRAQAVRLIEEQEEKADRGRKR